MEKTLVILKPDAVKRKLMGEIIQRFEKKNISIIEIKMTTLSKEILLEHYAHVKDKPIFGEMVDFMASGQVAIMVLAGENVIKTVRTMIGKTSSYESLPGTIRGDFGFHSFENLIHASDSVENADIEIKRFFRV